MIVRRLGLAVPLFLVACSSSAQQASKAQVGTDVVATAGGAPITLSEVDDKALQQPAGTFGNMKLSMALYEARRTAIEDIVGEKLLALEAKARGITSAALMDQEIGARLPPSPKPTSSTGTRRTPGACRALRSIRCGRPSNRCSRRSGRRRCIKRTWIS
jgi:hypothetical protein